MQQKNYYYQLIPSVYLRGDEVRFLLGRFTPLTHLFSSETLSIAMLALLHPRERASRDLWGLLRESENVYKINNYKTVYIYKKDRYKEDE